MSAKRRRGVRFHGPIVVAKSTVSSFLAEAEALAEAGFLVFHVTSSDEAISYPCPRLRERSRKPAVVSLQTGDGLWPRFVPPQPVGRFACRLCLRFNRACPNSPRRRSTDAREECLARLLRGRSRHPVRSC
jgi:hypothetical protein